MTTVPYSTGTIRCTGACAGACTGTTDTRRGTLILNTVPAISLPVHLSFVTLRQRFCIDSTASHTLLGDCIIGLSTQTARLTECSLPFLYADRLHLNVDLINFAKTVGVVFFVASLQYGVLPSVRECSFRKLASSRSFTTKYLHICDYAYTPASYLYVICCLYVSK